MEKLLSSVDRRELLELTGVDELSVCWLREDTEERGLCELVSDIEEPEVMRLDDFKLSTGTDTLLVSIFELAFLELIGIDVLAGIDELDSFLLEIDTQELGVCELEGVIIDDCELLKGIGDLLAGTDELASLGLAETNVLGFCELGRDAEECTLVEPFDRVDEPELGFIVLDNPGMLWLIDELALPELGFRELERGAEELNDCELFDATDELVGVTLDTSRTDELSDIDEPDFCELEGDSEKGEEVALNDFELLFGRDELFILELAGIEELGVCEVEEEPGFCELTGVFEEAKECALDEGELLKGIEELFFLELGFCELHKTVELCSPGLDECELLADRYELELAKIGLCELDGLAELRC
ncbi:hypothetical protein VCV18_010833 [Metarhizium anisopliae]